MDESRKKEVMIDVKEIVNKEELHELLMTKLEFPEFYGKNWDAFWDIITGSVELPERIEFDNWSELVKTLPTEADILKSVFIDFNKEFPLLKSEVVLN